MSNPSRNFNSSSVDEAGRFQSQAKLRKKSNMRLNLRQLAWFVGTAFFAISFSTIGNAQNPKTSTTIDRHGWTDEEIKKEFNRYNFTGLEFLDKGSLANPKLVILSGFSEVGKNWQDLDSPIWKNTRAAFVRAEELMAFYESPASLRISLLARLIRLIKTERLGDWDCGIGLGCYPKGYVVGLGPVDSETAKQVCELQRHNHYFCGVYER